MPIKNFWSIEAGEAMVAEAIQKNLPGFEVFFPIKDVGVDLLAVSGVGTNKARIFSFQVKESRPYESHREITPPGTATNWFVLDPLKNSTIPE
jgi:hypothetical protein